MTAQVDTVLRDGQVYDGRGGEPTVADVAMQAGRIVAVGSALSLRGRQEVDCGGLAVCPGFVDVHAHDDLAALGLDGLEPKVRQGVTTTVVGNCGHGAGPVGDHAPEVRSYSSPVLGSGPEHWPWRTFADYLTSLRRAEPPLTVLPLVPHGAARIAVMGFEARPASGTEQKRILDEIRAGLDAGGAGVSFGLMYAPACFAATAELVAVAELVAAARGVLAVHLRSEGGAITESLKEMRHVAEVTGVRLHVSHLKCTGVANHGRMPEVVGTLDDWRRRGIDVTTDVYPYTAGSTTVCGMLPEWALAGGVDEMLVRLGDPGERNAVVTALGRPWERMENHLLGCGADSITLVGLQEPRNRAFDGQPLASIAAARGASPEETLVDVVVEERARPGVIQHQGLEADLEAALRWPHTMIGSDGLPTDVASPHPRLYGTFPRALGRYARDKGVLSMPEAIRRMTSLPAQRFGLVGRGELRAGAYADVVVFDPATVTDTATYDAPRSWPRGVHQVWRGGRALWHDRSS